MIICKSVICFLYFLSSEDKSKFPPDFNEEMTQIAQMKFAWKSTDNVNKKVAECLRQLKDALNIRKLVSYLSESFIHIV